MRRSTSTDGYTIAAGGGVGLAEGVGVGVTDGVGVGVTEGVGMRDDEGDGLALPVRDGDGDGDREDDGDGLTLPDAVGEDEGDGDGELSAYARVEATTQSSPRKSAKASGLTGGCEQDARERQVSGRPRGSRAERG